MSEAERRAIELASLARGAVVILMSAAAQRDGLAADITSISAPARSDAAVTIRRHRLDLASAVAKYMSVELKALALLGLERRQKPVTSLAAYVEAQARAVRGES
jgi:hypothetical protein